MEDDDEVSTLFTRAASTLDAAEVLLKAQKDTTSIVNRSYYAVFYAAIALLKKKKIELTTSKHAGVMAAFDNPIVRLDRAKRKRYSRILHDLFDSRLDADYDFQVDTPSRQQAEELFNKAKEFYHVVLGA
jgi:uncharacterized protein (UPF0332 family)